MRLRTSLLKDAAVAAAPALVTGVFALLCERTRARSEARAEAERAHIAAVEARLGAVEARLAAAEARR